MALLSVDRYRELTGDLITPDVVIEPALSAAQELIEAELRRPLESAERTESMRTYGSRVYPQATPVTAVAHTSHTIGANGNAIDGAAGVWHGWDRTHTTVTYTGGYTSLTVPADIADAIAAVAMARLTQAAGTSSDAPAGAKSVTVGDVRVEYSDTASAVGTLPGSVTARLAKYRRRFV